MKIKIRYNKSKGLPGRGTADHAWRVFVGPKEYLAKGISIKVPSWGEKEQNSEDWNICCEGQIEIDRANSSIIVLPEPLTSN